MKEQFSLNETYIHRVFQLSGLLQIKDSVFGTAKYNSTLIYNWTKNKFTNLNLPDRICTISRERGGQSVDIIYDYNQPYFCVLAQHPDVKVASRMWSTEAEIIIQEDNVRIGVKLSYSSPAGNDDEVPDFSIPSFVKSIAFKNGIYDSWKLEKKATYINSEDDLEAFVNLLKSEERLLPVVAIAECDKYANNDNPFMKGYLIDADRLAENVFLTAHVVALPDDFQDKFEDIVGEKFRVNNGAVRTYYPGLKLEDDDSSKRHPFTTSWAILASSYTDDDGKDCTMGEAYQHFIVDRIHQYMGKARIKWPDLGHKFYYAANRERLQSKLSNTSDATLLIKEFQKQIKQNEEEIKSSEEAAYSAMEDTEKVQNQLDDAKDTIHRLNAKIDNLQYQLENSTGYEKSISIPASYEELPKWVNDNFPGRMVLHPRALKSLKEAEFDDVELVYKSLELLGTEYYKMRSGSITRESFDEKCKNLGISESACIADNRAGELGETYFIKDYHGHKVKIDRHIKNGSATRDPKRCMRIYFFWDDEMEQVVICYLPQHQQIRTS